MHAHHPESNDHIQAFWVGATQSSATGLQLLLLLLAVVDCGDDVDDVGTSKYSISGVGVVRTSSRERDSWSTIRLVFYGKC